jgi:hypothetical protein
MALAKKKPAAPKVPKFSSRAEEAEFWSAQSPLDFGEFSELASVPASGEPMHRLTLVLDGDMIERLGATARSRGMSLSDLVASWLSERLAQTPTEPRT